MRYYDRSFNCTIHGGPVAERLSRAAGTDLLLARTTGTAGFIWSSPVSILLRSEVEALGLPTDLGRYRANLVVDDRDAPLTLGAGNVLDFGEVRLVVERELDRCLVVNHDPVTGEHDEDLLHRLRPGVLLGHGARVESGGLLRAGGPAGLWQG
ncbi:MOSC domain-containing protein [Luteococcus sp. OSA5]|uniref:MOSC domain-containing protein n=1 Tax=Luteococcus sp. OSA5 TaxID=3401630 RepID=UPI003B434A30